MLRKAGKRYQSRGLNEDDEKIVEKPLGDGQHLYLARSQSQMTDDFLNRNIHSLTKSLYGGATPNEGEEIS